MDSFDRMLVTKDSMLSFTFNSRKAFAILDLQIVEKEFSMSKHKVVEYFSLREASHMLDSMFVRT